MKKAKSQTKAGPSERWPSAVMLKAKKVEEWTPASREYSTLRSYLRITGRDCSRQAKTRATDDQQASVQQKRTTWEREVDEQRQAKKDSIVLTQKTHTLLICIGEKESNKWYSDQLGNNKIERISNLVAIPGYRLDYVWN